ncbi:hypothetical protein BDQ12DRAFT_684117 [Crucibulum laeve]|uniref:Protein kinase domain-containing protein n=1 Tax=Crucibulum laeve TaxID=68775 RepID=A0A5C3MAK3_9AGAR|nr:hypothetical protein BDQ12DRAFT_684117 [Crucibulum laeve]
MLDTTYDPYEPEHCEGIYCHLYKGEDIWAKLYPLLLSRGYRLRPRYAPGWIPSWTLPGNEHLRRSHCEDALGKAGKLLDATRLSDDTKVVLKMVDSDEADIAQYLSSLSDDATNHTVPVLDIINATSEGSPKMLLVMPMLLQFENLPFRRLGEVTEAFQQFLEGLVFMHDHNVAHRDACWNNLMMDISKVIPDGYHFCFWDKQDGIEHKIKWNERWTVKPVKYFFIDFEFSRRYSAEEDRKIIGLKCQDKTVPELSSSVPYDPFKVDIYHLGNVINKMIKVCCILCCKCLLKYILHQEYDGLELLRPLADTMTRKDPVERPTASEAYEQFKKLTCNLKKSRLQRRIWRMDLSRFDRLLVRYCGMSEI